MKEREERGHYLAGPGPCEEKHVKSTLKHIKLFHLHIRHASSLSSALFILEAEVSSCSFVRLFPRSILTVQAVDSE